MGSTILSWVHHIYLPFFLCLSTLFSQKQREENLIEKKKKKSKKKEENFFHESLFEVFLLDLPSDVVWL